MAISKVVYGGDILIDLTADSVKSDKLLKGYTAHGADGEPITGSCEFDADTKDATATEAEILSGKTAYNKGTKITGTMTNNGAANGVISIRDKAYTIPQGYHDGSGKVAISPTEQAKIIPSNIREGVSVLGVVGTMTGSEGVISQSKSVTPSSEEQTVLPDDGYTHLAEVTVAAIPYIESDNSAGGKTVTIG